MDVEPIAHTIEEGGAFFAGPPMGGYHSLFWEDGRVFDETLKAFGINGGWRQRKTPEQVAEIKRLIS